MENASSPQIELRSSPPPSLPPSLPPCFSIPQKRTRASHYQDDSTPSDGPLFSSDPPDPSVDEYLQPRRKRQYRGTWWGDVVHSTVDEPVQQRTKSGFSRNMDSGVWMGSDATDEIEAFQTDDTVPDDPGPDSPEPDYNIRYNRRPPLSDSWILPPPVSQPPQKEYEARNRIHDCLENSKEIVSLSSLALDRLPHELIAPLHTMVRDQGAFDPQYNETEDEFRDRGLVPRIQLYLSRNALKSLPLSLFTLQNVTVLNIANNNLTCLSPHIGKLENLSCLNLQSNRLRWLPWEFLRLVRQGKLENINVDQNPFFQPFSYVGPWHQPCHPLSPLPADDHTDIWYPPPTLSELVTRLEDAQATQRYLLSAMDNQKALQDLDNVSDIDPRSLYQAIEHANWMRHFYINYAAKPQLIVMTMAPGQKAEDEACPDIVPKRGGAVHIASTPIVRFGIDGSPLRGQQKPAPSLLAEDELLLNATLGEDYLEFTGEGNVGITSSALKKKIAEATKPKTKWSSEESPVPSLLELALQSATEASQKELSHLSSLLPEDTPDSVQRSLKTAVDVYEEGGRICSVCSRSYVIPRTEWVEYWHVLNNSKFVHKTMLFLPFLRRGCSLRCIPERNEEEQGLRANLSLEEDFQWREFAVRSLEPRI